MILISGGAKVATSGCKKNSSRKTSKGRRADWIMRVSRFTKIWLINRSSVKRETYETRPGLVQGLRPGF